VEDAETGKRSLQVGDREGEASGPHEKPVVDVSAALGEAGHEVEDLGYEGVPDEGSVLREAGAHDQTVDVVDALDAIAGESPSD
jgi:hypothetical protein